MSAINFMIIDLIILCAMDIKLAVNITSIFDKADWYFYGPLTAGLNFLLIDYKI